MRYQLLGPLTVSHENRPIRLGGPRQQILLAMLLLEANQVMDLDRLIDAIWSEQPPTSAKTQIRICVSEIRRRFLEAGCGESIETHSSGYLLRVENEALDLRQFKQFVARGRQAARDGHDEEAMRLLKAALALWRGPMFSGLNSTLLDAAAVRFDEERQVVIEEYVDLCLALGMHREIVGELAGYVADAPFQENLCAQYMWTLHRCGRKAEALEFFRYVRRRFADELGIEPSRNLRRAETRILTDESGGEPVSSITYVRTPDRHVGVEDRLSRLEQELEQLRSEYSQLVGRSRAQAGGERALSHSRQPIFHRYPTGIAERDH
ncbi:hypothetical protein ALI144C_06205 [Actinosynnema sp. ALI-1.44]|nr:hypothetical protein ALI144C_06205 [Actinosynnema sp. ALI-1.44]